MNTRIAVLTSILAIGFSWAMANPAMAGPNCEKKPDHPSCSGGGGGGGDDGGGGGDACAASSAEFPTFAFQRAAGNGRYASIDIIVAGADGACQRTVATMGERASHISFTFNAPTGRLAWVSRNHDIWFTEFTVNGKDVQSTTPPKIIVDALDAEYLHGVFGLDLDQAGQSLVFSLEELFGTTGGASRWTVRKFDDVTSLPCASPCSPEDATVLYVVDEREPDVTNAALWDIHWDDTGGRLYLRQGINDAQGSRRELVLLDKQSDGTWLDSVLFRDSDYYDRFNDIMPGIVDYGDGRGGREVLALWVPSNDRCNEQTYVIDVQDCAAGTGFACSAVNTPYSGRNLGGWTSTGRLIVEEASSVEGKGVGGVTLCDVPDTIAEVDVFSVGAPATTLVEGSNPDAG